MALVPGATLRTLDRRIHAAWSDASRGDLRPHGPGPDGGSALAGFADEVARATGSPLERVAWLTQVHGSAVRAVSWEASASPRHGAPAMWHLGEGDALVSVTPGVALCVLTADCAPVALASPEGVFGAVHAGWRGLVDGVVEQAVARMRARGATDVSAALGPCIHASCYEFAERELDVVADRYGPGVRATTTAGRPALDLAAGVAAAIDAAGARMADVVATCTACGGGQFSHRARRDAGRQALLVWSSGPRAAS